MDGSIEGVRKIDVPDYSGIGNGQARRLLKEQRDRLLQVSETLSRVGVLLSTAIELRDPYTRGHSEHVAEITVNIVKMKFPKDFSDIRIVKMAALIHDVGKVAINENILNKPTLLTEAEFEMIKCHTKLGRKLIEPLGMDQLLTDAVYSHHENFDGSGYPEGLCGEKIPLIARIIRVADYFDALTTRRPYRDAFRVDEAIERMKERSNYFDPDILTFFIKNIGELTSRFACCMLDPSKPYG